MIINPMQHTAAIETIFLAVLKELHIFMKLAAPSFASPDAEAFDALLFFALEDA